MPAPTAIVFRPGRRGHWGRRGRRGNRSHFRAGLPVRCLASRDRASSSASPVSAPWRSRTRRARAASARTSALATSSSVPASATAPESTPDRDGDSSGSVTSAASSQWSASTAPDGARRRSLSLPPGVNGDLAQLLSSLLHAETHARLGMGRSSVRGPPARTAVLAQAIFSNQENFLFRCDKVIWCD